ncbi:MAG: ferredoxin--NADP reductase [Planctomycetota bacterium]
MAVTLNARVVQRIEVAPGLIILRVVPEGWELPDFEPGQFAVLGLPGSAPRCKSSDPEETPSPPDKLINRAYSIASSSVVKEYLEFYVTLVSSGALTPRLFHLQVGDALFLGKKITGAFTLDELPPGVNVVFMATGTGLAPYMSMMRTYLAKMAGRRLAVVHGARHSWDLGYRSELHTLQTLFEYFDYIPIVSRPKDEKVAWTGFTGYVQDVWTRGCITELWGFAPTPENTHILLCGNPAMIEHCMKLLESQGFREHTKKHPGQLHAEKYW